MEIDLNCDLGEGCAFDEELMPLITSANISCGFHAGDPASAKAALKAAQRHDVQVGAHPGFADREHFGRREIARTEEQVFDDCVFQVGALKGWALASAWPLRYIKPHGALYNMACRDDAYARPIVEAALQYSLPVMGLPKSRLEAQCQGRCLFIAEGFADRRYLPDGSLVPRNRPEALIENPDEAVSQVESLIKRGMQTICVHGDNPQALGFLKNLRSALDERGIAIRAFATQPINS